MRTMKKLFLAGMFALALCLPASAATGKSETPNMTKDQTQASVITEKGICYRLANCRNSFLENVTQTECWNNGGNSWRAAATGECVNNKTPE